MIIKQSIKEFERLGLGLFVHFGAYSVLGRGEWSQDALRIPFEEYKKYTEQFNPNPDWAKNLVASAKKAGCRYITLTTRHHDGFSLFDTCGLNDYDTMHTICGRDLVREFVDACREQGIIPFLYHTLIDWYEPHYETDFPKYLKYLRDSVELLCKNYGKIGGFWFDGMWKKRDADWEEDALYAVVRKYQPDAMLINNTGMGARGALGHIELDSVTFERSAAKMLNMEGAPKYVAMEVCQGINDHWGYAATDLNYKSPGALICQLAESRKYRANYLLNVGPKPDGSLRLMEQGILENLGQWMQVFDEAMHEPAPTHIEIQNQPKDFLLSNGNTYYLFCYDLPLYGDVNVVENRQEGKSEDVFRLDRKVIKGTWMDNGQAVEFTQNGDEVTVKTEVFPYGTQYVVRVAKLECE